MESLASSLCLEHPIRKFWEELIKKFFQIRILLGSQTDQAVWWKGGEQARPTDCLGQTAKSLAFREHPR